METLAPFSPRTSGAGISDSARPAGNQRNASSDAEQLGYLHLTQPGRPDYHKPQSVINNHISGLGKHNLSVRLRPNKSAHRLSGRQSSARICDGNVQLRSARAQYHPGCLDTVADIQKEMRRYSNLLGIGPWFLVGPFVPAKGVYRGAKTKMRLSLAVAFAGRTMVE